jgi:tRNA(fMet)-specific endonuclease VapC
MYILDTDHLSLIQRNGQEGKRILARLSALENPTIAVTVITYEEQVRGRLNLVSKAKTLDERIRAYAGLQQISTDYRLITIIAFDRAAGLEHERLRKAYPRLGNMDVNYPTLTLSGRERASQFKGNSLDSSRLTPILFWSYIASKGSNAGSQRQYP